MKQRWHRIRGVQNTSHRYPFVASCKEHNSSTDKESLHKVWTRPCGRLGRFQGADKVWAVCMAHLFCDLHVFWQFHFVEPGDPVDNLVPFLLVVFGKQPSWRLWEKPVLSIDLKFATVEHTTLCWWWVVRTFLCCIPKPISLRMVVPTRCTTGRDKMLFLWPTGGWTSHESSNREEQSPCSRQSTCTGKQ